MARKLKGQNTAVSIVSALTGLRDEFTDIKDCTITFDRDVTSEGYLGQTTEQHDDNFKGVSFKLTAHSRKKKIVALIHLINQVTRGDSVDSITIATTLRFPDGTMRVIIPDCKFGNLEIGNSGKSEFVTFPMEGSADDYLIVNVFSYLR